MRLLWQEVGTSPCPVATITPGPQHATIRKAYSTV
jgi:hypothetical protein